MILETDVYRKFLENIELDTATQMKKMASRENVIRIYPFRDRNEAIPVTALPSKDEEIVEVLTTRLQGSSRYTESLPFACSCGLEFGNINKEISLKALNENDTSQFNEVCKAYNLNGCCRMRLLAPLIAPVVSVDINAFENVDAQVNISKGVETQRYLNGTGFSVPSIFRGDE